MSLLDQKNRVCELSDRLESLRKEAEVLDKQLQDQLNGARTKMEESINAARQRYHAESINIIEQRTRLREAVEGKKSPCG